MTVLRPVHNDSLWVTSTRRSGAMIGGCPPPLRESVLLATTAGAVLTQFAAAAARWVRPVQLP